MSRNGSGVYSLPAGYLATDGQTIEVSQHNPPLEDLADDANAARPVVAGGTGATSDSAARDNLEIDAKVLSKSADYTALIPDRSTLIKSTATLTLSLTAAATLGDGWFVDVLADTGTMTIDPSGAELIDGAATMDVTVGKSARIRCDGTGFYSQFYNDNSDKIGSVVEDLTPQLGGSLDTNGFAISTSQGTEVASATELVVVWDGNVFNVTGTTQIEEVDTTAEVIPVGSVYILRFFDILILKHDVTKLSLLTDADITTIAGDNCLMQKHETGKSRMLAYNRKDGTALTAPTLPVGLAPTADYTDISGSWTSGVSQQNTSTVYKEELYFETLNSVKFEVSDDDVSYTTIVDVTPSDRYLGNFTIMPEKYWKLTLSSTPTSIHLLKA